jgi:hypothetical protein
VKLTPSHHFTYSYAQITTLERPRASKSLVVLGMYSGRLISDSTCVTLIMSVASDFTRASLQPFLLVPNYIQDPLHTYIVAKTPSLIMKLLKLPSVCTGKLDATSDRETSPMP